MDKNPTEVHWQKFRNHVGRDLFCFKVSSPTDIFWVRLREVEYVQKLKKKKKRSAMSKYL